MIDSLREIGDALVEGSSALQELVATYDATGRGVDGRIARLMHAAVRRDRPSLDDQLQASSFDFWTRRADLHFLLVWTLFWTHGPRVALRTLGALPDRAGGLPAPWIEVIDYLVELDRLLDASPERSLPPRERGRCALASRRSLPAIELVLNGNRGCFLVDTGAPTSVVSRDFADRAGLRQGARARTVFDGGGRPLHLRPAIADSIEAPGLPGPAPFLDVAPLSPDLGVDGILSPLSAWPDSAISFEGPAATLAIGGSEPSNGPRTYAAELLWSDGSPHVAARIDGRRVLMLVDTGAGANLLTTESAIALGVAVTGVDRLESPTAAGTVSIHRGIQLRLAVGSARTERANLLVKQSVAQPSLVYPSLTQGYLGQPWLRERVVRVEADRRALTFSAPT